MGNKWATKKKYDYKLSKESADECVRALINHYEIEIRETSGDDPDIIDRNLDDLSGYYRRGLLENKEDENLGFCVIQHLKSGDTLTYRELKGKDRLVHSEYPMERQFVKKYGVLMGKLCGLAEDSMYGLTGEDYHVATSLALVFFFV
jgi:hypothetical protein